MSASKTSLEQVLAGAQLPGLPHSAIALLELSQNPKNGPAEYSVPIESDPGLASQVLRFVNSSYFGFRQEVSSVQQAIAMLGVRTLQNFLLWSAVYSLIPDPKCGPFSLKCLWQDSLRRGIFARGLGKRLKLREAEDLFAIALLQDMAVPVLAKELPAEYDSLLTARQGGTHRLSDLEREQLGWTHAEAGAMLARRWQLPQAFAETIEQHATVKLPPSKRSGAGLNVIGLSALLPSACDPTWTDRETFLAALEMVQGDGGEGAEELLAEVDQEFSEFAPFMKVTQPARSLVDFLQADPVEA
jgi:HD-like signal output (HDOD) protein